MKIEIITPEKKMFEGEAVSVQFPGINGSFQVLKDHASIISTLTEGEIKIELFEDSIEYESFSGSFERDSTNSKLIYLRVNGGVMEMQNDKIIVLAD